MNKSMTAIVWRAHKGQVHNREGRGFSLNELRKAEMDRDKAKRLHLMIDPRRKTVYDLNVETLRKIAEEMKEPLKKTVQARGTEPPADSEKGEAVEAVEAVR